MAYVPRLTAPTVAVDVTPQPYMQARASALSQGGGLAIGLQRLGQGATDLGMALHKIEQQRQAEADEAELLEATNRADALARDTLYGDGGYMNRSGRDAAQGRDEVLKQYQDGFRQIQQGLSSPELRNQWEKTMAGRNAAVSLDVYQHSAREARSWRNGEREARILNETASAAAFYNNPERLAANLAGIREESLAYAQSQGWGAEQTSHFLRGNLSAAHFAVAQRMVEAGQFKQASAYIAQHAGQMSTNHLILADKAWREAAVVYGGQAAADAAIAYGRSRGSVSDETLYQTEASENLFGALVRQESAGNAAAVSSKGAAGLAQVMPDTAREIAQELGESDVAAMSDAEVTKFLQVPENGLRYGLHYLNKQLKQYDGEVVLALAAYNAGPGRADEWIEKFGDPRLGEIDPMEWADSIPFPETRAYVAGVLTKASTGSPEQEGGDWYTLAAEEVAQIEDPQVRAVAQRRLDSVREVEDRKAERSRKELEQTVEAALEAGGNPDDLDPAVRQRLGVVKMNSLREAYSKRNDRRTDFELYAELSALPPEAMAEVNLFSLQHRLEPTHYAEMVKRRDAARKLRDGRQVDYEPFTLTQRRSALFDQLGFTSKDRAQEGRLAAAIDLALRDAAAAKGEKLTPDEEDAVMQRSLTVVDEGGFFSSETLLGEVDDLSDLPSEVRNALKDAFPGLSDQELLATYLRLKLSGAIQ